VREGVYHLRYKSSTPQLLEGEVTSLSESSQEVVEDNEVWRILEEVNGDIYASILRILQLKVPVSIHLES
jgi:hypothetical protein